MKASNHKVISRKMLQNEQLLDPNQFTDDYLPSGDDAKKQKAREMFMRQAGTKEGIHVRF